MPSTTSQQTIQSSDSNIEVDQTFTETDLSNSLKSYKAMIYKNLEGNSYFSLENYTYKDKETNTERHWFQFIDYVKQKEEERGEEN